MRSRSYYTIEELLLQRKHSIRFGMDPSGIEFEIELVVNEITRAKEAK